jgi:hypothetical protein
MNIRKNIFLALTSGLLLGLPWSASSLFFVVFIAWVPLLLLEEEVRHDANAYAICQFPAVEYHRDLVGYAGTMGGRHRYHDRKFTSAGPCILAGKPYPDDLENSPVVPFSTHLDGVRIFSSILGPGLALA